VGAQGLEIKCDEKGVEEFKELIDAWISQGADSWYASANIEFVTQMLDERMSYMSMVQNDIPYILGRPAKTVREFLSEHRDVVVASASQQ
jgi:phosphoserine phosphatase